MSLLTEEMRDRIAAAAKPAERTVRRGRSQPGEQNGRAVLLESDVHAIRRWLSEGMGVCAVARRAGLDHSTVRAIRDRRLWKHLEERG